MGSTKERKQKGIKVPGQKADKKWLLEIGKKPQTNDLLNERNGKRRGMQVEAKRVERKMITFKNEKINMVLARQWRHT